MVDRARKQRAVAFADDEWAAVKKVAQACGVSVSEYVRLTATAERPSVALVPVPSVQTVAVPVAGIDALEGLEQRIAERSQALGKSPDAWVRGLVEYTLDRAVPTGVIPVVKGKTADNDERVSAILAESKRREAAHVANGGQPWNVNVSRFAHLKTAQKGSQNLKWNMGKEPGPPAWMTAPMTRDGMTRDEAVATGQIAAMATMTGKSS